MKRILSKSAGEKLVDLDQFVVQAAIQWEYYWILINCDSFTD